MTQGFLSQDGSPFSLRAQAIAPHGALGCAACRAPRLETKLQQNIRTVQSGRILDCNNTPTMANCCNIVSRRVIPRWGSQRIVAMPEKGVRVALCHLSSRRRPGTTMRRGGLMRGSATLTAIPAGNPHFTHRYLIHRRLDRVRSAARPAGSTNLSVQRPLPRALPRTAGLIGLQPEPRRTRATDYKDTRSHAERNRRSKARSH
ncbi:hypothetical protein C8J26_2991 [Sphingomonas aurantiaca]|uniref:Uncharacterized protein n=1 Tax=Sphingomonas aurantiaca TaxID=185949 RepID=A0A2T5GIU7_9SPHN|nr:hypothetical protein C8J26_2991 [Sphingomonas aurantiaca]